MWRFRAASPTEVSTDPDSVTLASTPSSAIPYVAAAVIVVMSGLVALLLLAELRPALDITIAAGVVSAFIVSITTGVLAFMKSQETHKTVNSRMDGMLAVVRELAHERGLKEGRETQATAAAKTVAEAAEVVARAAATAAAAVASAKALDQNNLPVPPSGTIQP
jgi:hypothetical protein